LTPSDPKSSKNPSPKSDNELALRLTVVAEYAKVNSNLETVEKWIKSAEVVEQRVITAGIYELECANRQMDYATLKSADKKNFDEALAHLEKASESIYKALDDAVATIGREMQRYADDLEATNLNEHFVHYQALTGVFASVKRQIENSRENRDQWDEVYKDVAEGADFRDLRKYFDELRSNALTIRDSIEKKDSEARNSRRRRTVGISLAVISAVTGLTLVILSVLNF